MSSTEIVRPADPGAPAPAPAGDRPRPVHLTWWSRPGDPRWASPAALALAGVAAVVYGWGIGRVPLHDYYLPAVRSMSLSWRAWIYGGYDTNASITLDKLPGAFMLQALSVRVFGFHAWAVVLPEVVAAVLAVLVLYLLVRDWLGARAGLLAAGFLAITPIVAALARSEISDGILVLLLVLAAAFGQRAIRTGQLWPLLLCGVMVGLAFQTKMVQAWGVLPALAVAHLVAAPPKLLVRIGQVLLAGAVTVAVSLWQVALFALTPAGSRPYADGTSNNSLLSMIFEYNLSDRFRSGGGGAIGGPVSGGPGLTPAMPGAPPPVIVGRGPGGATGWQYMLGDEVAPQAGWLYPLALIGLVVGLIGWRRRADPVRAPFLLWGLWLAVHVVAFSSGRVAHSFYVVAVAPAVAALAAGGLVLLWRRHRRWLLPAALVVQAAWTVWLARRFPDFESWVVPATAVLVVAAVVVLAVGAPRRRFALGGLALGLAGVALAPAGWAAATVDPAYAGSAIAPAAGPGLEGRNLQFQGGGPAMSGPGKGGPPPGGGKIVRIGGPQNTAATDSRTRQLLAWLEHNRHGERYAVAAPGAHAAGPLIVAGADVLPMGGFSGQVPFPTRAQVADLVARHELRFVLLDGGQVPGGADTAMVQVGEWVTGHCAEASFRPGDEQTLYDCGRARSGG